MKFTKTPKSKCKDCNELNELKKQYDKKNINIVENNIRIDENYDLTIVVPVYNGEVFIKKCVESLINQKTKYKYNIIFINDGSTDKSLDMLKYYAKTNAIIKVITKENQGIAETRNVGIRNVSGKYVAFVDIDDFVTDNFVEMLLNTAYANNADIVRCNYYEFCIKTNKVIKTGKNQSNCIIKDGLKEKILKFKGYPWGGIFKSELWENVQFPEGYWYEDMIIRMIIFRKAKTFVYINDKLYYYCLHENNISKIIERTADNRCLDHYFLVKKLVKLNKKMNLKFDKSIIINVMYEYSVILWLRTRNINKKLRKAVFLDACEYIQKQNFDKEGIDKNLIDIFYNNNYLKWKMYAMYYMLGVKYGAE